MFKFKGVLRSSQEIIAEGHTLKEISNQAKAFRRGQKRGEHTDMNVPIDVYEIIHNAIGIGKRKEKLIKTI